MRRGAVVLELDGHECPVRRTRVLCVADAPHSPPPLSSTQPFNQHNREEPSRYVPIHSCKYLVELFPPPHAPPPAAREGKGEGEGGGGAEEEEAAILRNQRWVDDRLHELGEARCVWFSFGGCWVRHDILDSMITTTVVSLTVP